MRNPIGGHWPTFYEQVLGVNIRLPFRLWFSMLDGCLRRMLLSTEFLFALSMSFVVRKLRCRLGFSRRVDAASYRTASLRAKVGTQSSEHGVVATSAHERSSGGFGIEGHVGFLCGPDAMEKGSELARHRDHRSVLRRLASSLS
jgi:hypothetical protein